VKSIEISVTANPAAWDFIPEDLNVQEAYSETPVLQ